MNENNKNNENNNTNLLMWYLNVTSKLALKLNRRVTDLHNNVGMFHLISLNYTFKTISSHDIKLFPAAIFQLKEVNISIQMYVMWAVFLPNNRLKSMAEKDECKPGKCINCMIFRQWCLDLNKINISSTFSVMRLGLIVNKQWICQLYWN